MSKILYILKTIKLQIPHKYIYIYAIKKYVNPWDNGI